MGSNHSINRKRILEEYGVTNPPRSANENLMNKLNNNNAVPDMMASFGKENMIPSHDDIHLATAYLNKYANVSRRRMKTLFKTTTSKSANTAKTENVERKRAQTNTVVNSAILPAANTAVAKPKCQQLLNKNVTLTSSHFGMKCLGTFVCSRYLRNLPHLSVNEVIMWMKNVDRALMLSGWQDHTFLTTPNITFIYLIARDALPDTVHSINQLRAELLTILYMAYTYSGPEISYPLKPFLTEKNRVDFWNRCVYITNNLSSDMLKINKDSEFYEEIQTELVSYGCMLQRTPKRG